MTFVAKVAGCSALSDKEPNGQPGYEANDDRREINPTAAGSSLDAAEAFGADKAFASDAIDAILAVLYF